jgi:hypothetical protein
MDSRIFGNGTMGLVDHVNGKPHRYRSRRLAQWYESRKGTAA